MTWFPFKHHWTSTQPPRQGSHTRGIITPVGWCFPSPLGSTRGIPPQNISVKRLLFFLLLLQLALYFLFRFPLCLPKTMQHLRFPNLHPVFLCTGILQHVSRTTRKNNFACIFFIPVKPEQLNSEVFYILVMLSSQACGNVGSTLWIREEVRKGRDPGKRKRRQLWCFPYPVWEGDSSSNHTSRGMVKTGSI